ncbi:hypothetical protein [Frankia sp. CiP3]|uniref:hypothetical protein n=1 Tax=Frankia sp. CiP3 TaxID=2880971 RepID=UPI001EF73634|nr:hypothetical protein [Frankia sp. CiP3]
MTADYYIADWEQAVWQRRAATMLTKILASHRHLPILAWSVGSSGSTLVGHVTCLGSAEKARGVFDAWCDALSVEQRAEQPSASGGVYLWGAVRTGQVTVNLAARVFPDEDEE